MTRCNGKQVAVFAVAIAAGDSIKNISLSMEVLYWKFMWGTITTNINYIDQTGWSRSLLLVSYDLAHIVLWVLIDKVTFEEK